MAMLAAWGYECLNGKCPGLITRAAWDIKEWVRQNRTFMTHSEAAKAPANPRDLAGILEGHLLRSRSETAYRSFGYPKFPGDSTPG
jgi:hypothetical protein